MAHPRMALVLYGSRHSRTQRVLWLLAELELPFEHFPWEWDDPRLKAPDFLARNPAGAVPTLVDGDLALPESLAINLYLARRYATRAPRGLSPATPAGEAQAIRWSLWAQGHLEPWIQQDRLLEPAIAAHGSAMVRRSLDTLARVLDGSPWIAGAQFGIADLNVAGVLSPSRARHLDLERHPAVGDWLQRCYERPACRRARAG